MGEARGQNSESRAPFELDHDFMTARITEVNKLKSHPDKIVRKEKFINNSVDDTIAFYKDAKSMYGLMKNNYGVNTPDVDIVLGETKPGEKHVFMVVDKIEGKIIGECENVSESEVGKFETFYLGLLQSMFDAYKNKKPFFDDIHDENIMYGHRSKEKDAQNDFFLTDIGTEGFEYYRESKEDDFPNYDDRFIGTVISHKESEIATYEKMFENSVALNRIREKVDEIYKYIEDNKRQELDRYLNRRPKKQDFEEFIN